MKAPRPPRPPISKPGVATSQTPRIDAYGSIGSDMCRNTGWSLFQGGWTAVAI